MKKLFLLAFLLLSTLSANSKKAGEFTVLQWNIWQEGTSVPGGYDAIINEIVRLKPDFVTFSEVRNYNKSNFSARVLSSLREKGLAYYSFYSYRPTKQTSHYRFSDCFSRKRRSR